MIFDTYLWQTVCFARELLAGKQEGEALKNSLVLPLFESIAHVRKLFLRLAPLSIIHM